MKILILVLALALVGCKTVDRTLMAEVKTADGQTVLIPDPIIVGTTSVVGPAMGPYGVAGSAVALAGLSLWASWRNRKRKEAAHDDPKVIVK